MATHSFGESASLSPKEPEFDRSDGGLTRKVPAALFILAAALAAF